MGYARIHAKSGTVATKENSETVLAKREMAYVYPEEIGKGSARLICGDGDTPIKDLPYVLGDDAADLQISAIDTDATGSIQEGMTLSEIIGIFENKLTAGGIATFSTIYYPLTNTLRISTAENIYIDGEGVLW